MTPQTPEQIVEERGRIYGPPHIDFQIAQSIKRELLTHFEGTNHLDYDRCVEHFIDMIATKLARLMYSPCHLDTIDDIAGYALCLRKCYEELIGGEE